MPVEVRISACCVRLAIASFLKQEKMAYLHAHKQIRCNITAQELVSVITLVALDLVTPHTMTSVERELQMWQQLLQ